MKRNYENVTSCCIIIGLKGEFYDIKTHSEPPFVAQPFTLPMQPGYMLSLGLSEFTLNSASFGYYTAGLFQAVINDSMVSALQKCIEEENRVFWFRS